MKLEDQAKPTPLLLSFSHLFTSFPLESGTYPQTGASPAIALSWHPLCERPGGNALLFWGKMVG